MDWKNEREELIEPYIPSTPKPKKKLKEKIGTSPDKVVNQLCEVKSATVFYDIVSAISRIAEEKKISIYVYRKDRGERCSPRCVLCIAAVKAGNPKTYHPQELKEKIVSLESFPIQVNPHRASKQHRLLLYFLKELSNAT